MTKKGLYILLFLALFSPSIFAEGAKTIMLEASISLVSGEPLDGEHRVIAKLYADETEQDWEEIHRGVDFDNGLAAIELGSVTEITPDLLDISTPNLVLLIEGEEIVVPLYSSFFALRSQSTDHIEWTNIEGREDPILDTLRFSQVDIGDTTSTATVDWSSGSKQKIRLTGDTTLTFTVPDGTGHLMLIVKQDSTGGHELTWPSLVKWPGGVAPELTTDASAIDVISLYYDGEVYLGSASFDFK